MADNKEPRELQGDAVALRAASWTKWGVIVAALSLVAMIVLSISSTSSKDLELECLARLSLVSSDVVASGKVSLLYENSEVKSLTKVAARLTNSGNVPIMAGDVEAPVCLSFPSTRVINASIVRTSPVGIAATCESGPESVSIRHGLLNSGDSIEFEVMCDGEPNWPVASCRIAGVRSVRVVSPETGARKSSALPDWMPRSFWVACLAVQSLSGCFFVVGSLVLLFQAIGSAFPKRVRASRVKLARQAAEHVSQRVAAGVIKDANGLRGALAESFFEALPPGVDAAGRNAVNSIGIVSGEPLRECFDRIVGQAVTKVAQLPVRVDRDNLLAGLMLLVIGIASTAVAVAAWLSP